MKKMLLVLSVSMLAFAGCKENASCHAGGAKAAATDSVAKAADSTDLVLQPTAEQIAKAHRVGNKHCPTDGQKLGSMGAPIPVIYKGELVELCCGGCPGEFAKDPAKYLAIAKADTALN